MSPLVYLTLVYITGILLARGWMDDASFTLVLLGILLLVGLFLHARRLVESFTLVLVGAFALAGFIYAYAYFFPPSQLPGLAGEGVTVEGTVVDEPSLQEGRTGYQVRVERLEAGGEVFDPGGKMQLYLYHDEKDRGDEGVEHYRYGERLRVRGTLREPSPQRNPGGFDYRFFLRTQGLDAYMHAQAHQAEPAGEGDTGLLRSTAFALRSEMITGIQSSLPSPHDDLLTAILFGQRDRLPEDVQENFQRSGAGHLMSVSGMHVGLVAGLFLALFRRFRLHGPTWTVVAIILVFGYAYLTGMRPPALRASLMISLGLLAVLWGRERDFPAALSLAALATLLYNPLLLFTVGFQLSYAATLAIYYLYPVLERELFFWVPRYLKSLLSVTLAAQLGVLPLMAYHFHQVPAAALFFNLLFLPVMALVVGLGLVGSLLYLLLPALSLPAFLANLPLLGYLLYVSSLAAAPSVLLEIRPPSTVLIVALYLVLALLAAAYYRLCPAACPAQLITLPGQKGETRMAGDDGPAGDPGRLFTVENFKLAAAAVRQASGGVPWKTVVMVVLIIALAWWWVLPAAIPDTMEVAFIDVGQGAAVYLETSCGFTALVDAGGELPFRDNVGKEVGERIILPFLYHRGVRELDLVVITHPHEDHYGGFIPVIGEIPVETLMISPVSRENSTYSEMLEEAREKDMEIKKVTRGKTFSPAPELFLEVMLPPEELYRNTGCDLNNNSVVLHAAYGEQDFLLTGDMEEEAIRDLLEREKDLSANVLKVPHHGGYFESVEEFLSAVDPAIAVIQVGENNPFDHPHPDITAALDEAGITTFRNDHHGAVIFRTDGTNLRWELTRGRSH